MQATPNKLRPALLAGAVIGAISGVPGLNLINCCCCAGILFGGALAYYLYLQEYRTLPAPSDPQYRIWVGTIPVDIRLAPEPSDALILGIIAGIVGAVTASLLQGFITLIFGPLEAEFVKKMALRVFDYLEKGGSVPAGALDQARDQLDESLREAITFGGFLRGLLFTLILYPIFSMLGGLIGYGLFGRKRSIQAPGAPQ
ncbi:MAG TPA: hypothetical protein VMM57_05840 [Bacteroidota bacterium]|nr:hypothetical protein [Bacteroidota bacterium]